MKEKNSVADEERKVEGGEKERESEKRKPRISQTYALLF